MAKYDNVNATKFGIVIKSQKNYSFGYLLKRKKCFFFFLTVGRQRKKCLVKKFEKKSEIDQRNEDESHSKFWA